jgi:hypothetical protein
MALLGQIRRARQSKDTLHYAQASTMASLVDSLLLPHLQTYT